MSEKQNCSFKFANRGEGIDAMCVIIELLWWQSNIIHVKCGVFQVVVQADHLDVIPGVPRNRNWKTVVCNKWMTKHSKSVPRNT